MQCILVNFHTQLDTSQSVHRIQGFLKVCIDIFKVSRVLLVVSMKYLQASVTIFGTISPLWHYFKSLGKFLGFIWYFAIVLSYFGKNVMLYGKFSLL